MDSLDWDAVRCVDVNEIAQTIKERGMNNMLTEHIQNFLNRLVEEHGSIDLEWLRDVPPDKAKEYLLSVKGLGLKSVECVRLLTLHHLAFPPSMRELSVPASHYTKSDSLRCELLMRASDAYKSPTVQPKGHECLNSDIREAMFKHKRNSIY
ncbi:endonuclease III [Vigna unguiculata]|uniref:Endonuclease III n=1 Tax=Vigna unguiculata TaxID=3917 RepID=A0A4D6MGL1_VIGUN|nr:endonuclease III [Vigna unguiculata]